jgi:hypothetical protein
LCLQDNAPHAGKDPTGAGPRPHRDGGDHDIHRLATLALGFGATVLLTACSTYVQTTSGSQYLSGYSASPPKGEIRLPSAGEAGTVDADIALAAAVEPQLRFPARLGLARIDSGRLTQVPPAEADAWRGLAERLGSGYGEFVSVSPLIAALATPEEAGGCRDAYGSCLAAVVK